MHKSEIVDTVISIIKEHDRQHRHVDENTDVFEDLGFGSLQVIGLILEVNLRFSLEINLVDSDFQWISSVGGISTKVDELLNMSATSHAVYSSDGG